MCVVTSAMLTTDHPMDASKPTERVRIHHLLSGQRYEAVEGIVTTYSVPNSVFDGTPPSDTMSILNRVFHENQNIGGNWLDESGIRTRSLSVGDVIELDTTFFVVEGVGFVEVPFEVALWLVTEVSSRDFWRSLGQTIRKSSPPPSVIRAAKKAGLIGQDELTA